MKGSDIEHTIIRLAQNNRDFCVDEISDRNWYHVPWADDWEKVE